MIYPSFPILLFWVAIGGRNVLALNTVPLGRWSEGGSVSVWVERPLPDVRVMGDDLNRAKESWYHHHWKKGGGLPIGILDNGGAHSDTGSVRRRTILPIGMEERIVADQDTDAATICYQVSEFGPFLRTSLVPGSHRGTVSFIPQEKGYYMMVWDVTFEATSFAPLYQFITRQTVGIASRTVQESLAPPRVFCCRTTIEDSDSIGYSKEGDERSTYLKSVRDKVARFVFSSRGGGLPLLPPLCFGDAVLDLAPIYRIPPFMIERITEFGRHHFEYILQDPGWNSFPFLLHTHWGKVSVCRNEDLGGTDLVWEVEIRPFGPAGGIWCKTMEWAVEVVISTIVRNVRVHIHEPSAMVSLRPPRGQGEEIGKVLKDTWLGGVVEAHFQDGRGAWEQTKSLFRPWEWGRSGNGKSSDTVRYDWKVQEKPFSSNYREA